MSKKVRKIRKEKKINKKRLIIVFFMMVILSVAVIKGGMTAVSGVSKFIGSNDKVVTNKGDTDSTQPVDKVVASEKPKEQFDLDDENSNVSSKHVVLIDASHGGSDKGTKGISGTNEKDVTIQIAKKVASKLSKYDDVQVLMSRTDDKTMTLEERATLSKEQNVDLLVSIHANAESGGNSATGIETFYMQGSENGSDTLAKLVQDTTISYVGARDRGAKPTLYEIVSQVDVPAALIECGFLTNKSEEKKLLDESYQEQLAEGICQGILSYIDKYID